MASASASPAAASLALPASASASASSPFSLPPVSARFPSSSKPSTTPLLLLSPSRSLTIAFASPAPDISQRLSESIKEAEELCAAEGPGGECAAAWDNVEEISAAIAHKREGSTESKDPLDKFCKDSPEADECRVYED